MANVTNNTNRPRGLPSGQIIPPGATVPVRDWQKQLENPQVMQWFMVGHLTADTVPDDAPPVDNRTEEDRAKDELIAKLAELGIKKTRSSKLESLQAAFDEASKK